MSILAKTSKRSRMAVIIVLSVVVLLAIGWFVIARGIFGGGEPVLQTMTSDQAAERIEDHIQRAVAALPHKPRLEPAGPVMEIPCDDVSSLRDRHGVERKYWLRDLSMSNADVFAALRDYWTGNGYRLLRDAGQNFTGLAAEHSSDQFDVGLQQNVPGDLLLWSSSPCVIKNER